MLGNGKRVCSANAIKENVLIGIIQDELNNLLEAYQIHDSIDLEIEDKLKHQIYKVKNEKKLLIAKRKKYEDSKTNLILSKAMQDITSEEYDASIKMVKEKVDEINDRLDELDNVNFEIGQDKIQKKIKEQFVGITDFSQINRELLNRFIKKIVVKGKNEVEIHYKFKK